MKVMKYFAVASLALLLHVTMKKIWLYRRVLISRLM